MDKRTACVHRSRPLRKSRELVTLNLSSKLKVLQNSCPSQYKMTAKFQYLEEWKKNKTRKA
jgi:hypothetical protein